MGPFVHLQVVLLGESLDAVAALIGLLPRMGSNVLCQLRDALEALVAFVAGVRHFGHWLRSPFLVLLRGFSLVAGPSFAHFRIYVLLLVAITLQNRWFFHEVRVGGRILTPRFEDAQILTQTNIAVFAFLFEMEGHSQPVDTIVADHRGQAVGFVDLQRNI